MVELVLVGAIAFLQSPPASSQPSYHTSAVFWVCVVPIYCELPTEYR